MLYLFGNNIQIGYQLNKKSARLPGLKSVPTVGHTMRVIKFRHGCHVAPRVLPLYIPGTLGDIARAMSNELPVLEKKDTWTPPYDYEFHARFLPEDQQEAYVQRCKDWVQSHKSISQPQLVIEEYDVAVVAAVYDKYKPEFRRPPCDELVAAYEKAGANQARIDKVKRFYKRWEDDSDKNQQNIDRIFFKYPSAFKPVKKEPVKQKKIIRAVKKKMNIDI